MTNKTKWLSISLCAGLAITTGGFFGYNTYADNIPKALKFEQLKTDVENEKSKFEKMPNTTPEEIKSVVEQGKKVKELDWEMAELQKELNPSDSKKILEQDIMSLKGILETKSYYKTMVDDPINGRSYAKAAEIVEQKKKDLTQLEKDFKEDKKPVDELKKEFERIRDAQELD